MDKELSHLIRTIHRRNIRETVAALLLVMWVGIQLLLEDRSALEWAGCVVILLSAVVIAAVSWGWLHIPADDLQKYPPSQSPGHWRRQLTSQAQGLRFAWLWYVLPLLTGIILILLGRGRSVTWTVALVVLAFGMALVIAWMNVAAARDIEKERDAWFPAE